MRDSTRRAVTVFLELVVGISASGAYGGFAWGEEWPQAKFDSRRSGDVPSRHIALPLGLVAAVPLSDAVFTSPAIAAGRVYVVDGSGVAWCLDAATLRVLWKVATTGGPANCNNVSSPAVAGAYLHFGTMVGKYYVLDAATGSVVRRIDCGEPVFSAPVVSGGRVYFATLGGKVYALEPDGQVAWMWDFVREVMGYSGDRWDGGQWLAFKKGRATWRDQFCVPIDIAASDRTVVVPAGGRTVWIEDTGQRPQVRGIGLVPDRAGKEYTAAFGQTLGSDGAVYRQWHRRDNTGRVEILRLRDGKVETDFVPGTETAINLPGLMSFSAVSLRGTDVYRCRPEMGYGLCRHRPGQKRPEVLCPVPAISSPVLTAEHAIYGALDGRLYVVPLSGRGETWSFRTPWETPISAPAAVADGRIYFGAEDGYLYVLGPGGSAPLPSRDLELWRIRTPLTGPRAFSEFDWFTNYGDLANTNANDQGLRPPLSLRWIRRYEGTFKHLPVFGGGRMYTHTAEGQIFAVEQSTGRLLWRRYFPDVYLSFTSPIYHRERLLVPQAGIKQSRLRCLEAATGRLVWEVPFTGSPSWSRQAPPTLWNDLAVYMFGSGKYAVQGTAKPFIFSGTPQPSSTGEEIMSWIYTHDNPYYPRDNRPLVRAWHLADGRQAWSLDFSELGTGGNDSGLCLMDNILYYSTFFGYAPRSAGPSAPTGLTAALDPATGKVLWTNTQCSVTAGCTISGRDGRLYLGGYNRPHANTTHRFVRCLDARDGSLIWQSEPVAGAVNVVSVGRKYLFANASGGDGYVLDRNTGRILSRFNFGYACTRFTLSEPYVLGCNMDMIDLSDGNKLVWTGPAVDSRECVGAVVSNGRMFYTAQASGLQLCAVYGEEAEASAPPWR